MYKILSLDGGGIGGLSTASMLATWEETHHLRIVEYFDLIVGTSTGGIIALGLGAGLSAADLREFYMSEGSNIFKTGFWRKRVFKAKYDRDELKSCLERTLKGAFLGHSSTRIVIPALNLEDGKPRIYKTAHDKRFILDYKKTMVEIALATSAAPTFFPSYSEQGIAYIDGGVWANNPVAVAVVEALAVLDWPADSFRILSIGCPTNAQYYGLAAKYSLGSTYWAAKVAPLLMHSASESAMNMAKLLTNHHDEDNKIIHRIQRIMPGNEFGLDKVSQAHLRKLNQLGEESAMSYAEQISRVFFTQPAAPFTPYHTC